MTIDQTKQAILKDFREKFISAWIFDDGTDNKYWHNKVPTGNDIESFLSESLDRIESECLKMKGQLKREWYQQGWKEAVESLKKNHE